MSADEAKEQAIREIARKHLRIGTLEVRNRDALDFHDCSVESIRAALEAAYEAGFNAAKESPNEIL
jgi:sulfite reductase beta subunit-like hemoprotein